MTIEGQSEQGTNVVETVVSNFGALFRHLFPGVLVLGVARIVRPCWFGWIDTGSWSNLAFTGVIALTVGNVCFAANRYVIFQGIDYGLYLCGCNGRPAKSKSHDGYSEALAAHVTESLYLPKVAKLADQHVKFRYAAVLFLYMIAELGLALVFFHHYACPSFVLFVFAFGGGIWQHTITRVIDQRTIEEGVRRRPVKPLAGAE